MDKDIILRTLNLTKDYNGQKVLKEISLTIEKGEIFGLIGENGAGKSTLMRIIAGSSRATTGEMVIMGATQNRHSHSRKQMGVMIEQPSCYGDMTAADNLEIIRLAKKIDNKSVVGETLKIVGLDDVGSKRVRKFSLGMRQRLGLAMALISSPKFLILDEPINGLDPKGIIDMRDLIRKLNRERGITFLISSHILTELHQVATRYGIMHQGKLIALHSAEEMERQCKPFIKIKHEDNMLEIVDFLKSKGLTQVTVENDEITISDISNVPKELLSMLVRMNYQITEYYRQQESIEDYFVRLTQDAAGGNNV
ncbi:ATP-binding cassette domain-containing protein [Paenibacillus lentus]|uniref:ATP-binding cassette domain-containing protein n=1 Tax=Paenibacillus lentus TaxID=1338368 RepID=A0A3S8RU91_9BACL|nr:ATP-binding cassette domain-containing protein [Paenibacillus lentus]AZK46518.1 ATP-binding cassette domain-containing protein [Paenibacillus lentus]